MTDTNPWNDAPVPPPSKKMNGCLLATLIIGGVGFFGLLVCCGGGVWLGTMFIPKVMNVPAEVTAVGNSILETKLPDDFQPTNANTMDNPFFDMKFARFAQKEGKGILILRSMKMKMGDANQANIQLAAWRVQDETEINSNLSLRKSESKEVTIGGQKVAVIIGEGTDLAGKGIHTAKADISTLGGTTYFMLRMDDDIWDEDTVLKMLENAKVP